MTRKYNAFAIALAGSMWAALALHGHAQTPTANGNPIAPHIYAADPAAHVWPEDPNTLYLYTSVDTPGTNHHASMASYHVFSTKDGSNWIDHGEVLSVDRVNWAVSHAWAIDAVFYEGKYYLVYCMKNLKDGLFSTGLAVSDRPEGPFEDTGVIEGVENGQDPALFIDDDGRKYLYWGYGHRIFGAELNTDLRSIKPETKIELSGQLEDAFEGPWMNKINGVYFLSYPGLPARKWPQHMYYATAKSPLGPFEPKGKFMEGFDGQAGTNHGSIVKWRDKWVFFYHSAWVSGGNGTNRSLMADFLNLSPDGRFSLASPTRSGIAANGTGRTILRLEAESGRAAGGFLRGATAEADNSGYSGRGYVTNFASFESLVGVSAYLAKPQPMKLNVRYSAPKDTHVFVMVNETNINGGYEAYQEITLKRSEGFADADLGVVDLKAAANLITLASRNESGLIIDYFELIPLP